MFFLKLNIPLLSNHWGAPEQGAEITPTEPAQDNACEGKEVNFFIMHEPQSCIRLTLMKNPMSNQIIKTVAGSLFLIIFLINPFCAFSQFTIEGMLTDKETGTPVVGALIQVDETFQFTTSNEDGRFSFTGLTKSNYPISITHISYELLKTTIQSGKENKIILQKRIYLSEEINISATRAEKSSAVSYTEISKAEITKYNLGKDIPSILNNTPSTVLTSDAGTGVGYSGIRIRGSDATRINVTINGIPVNDAESHQVYWVDLPDFASSTENIQVQRGIGSSTNGAGAFGGSVNILTNKLSTTPFATVNSSAGSFNTFKNTIQFGSGIFSKYFALEGRVSKITSDGYIDRSSANLRSFFLSGGFYKSNSSLRLIAFSGKEKTYQAWYGVPQDSLKTNRTYNPAGEFYDTQGNIHYYDNQTDNYRQDYYQLIFSHWFNNNFSFNAALHYTKGKGYYEEFKSGADYADYGLSPLIVTDTAIHSTDIIRQLGLANDFYGMTWSIKYENTKLNLVAGGSVNRYAGKHFGEVVKTDLPMQQKLPHTYYSDDANKTDLNVYVRADYSLYGKLKFFADLQERIISYKFTGFDNAYNTSIERENNYFFNPKAGISITPMEKIILYTSIGIGQKEPVRDDFVYSTPAKRPEREKMIDFESGLRYTSAKIQFGINTYYMEYSSQLILNGKINEVGEYIRESVKDSYRSGVEMEGMWTITSKINLKMNLTLSDNKITLYKEYVDNYDDGSQVMNVYRETNIAFSPQVIGSAAAGFIPFKNFNAEISGKYIGKQFLDNTSNESRKLDAYLVNDLHCSYKLPVKKLKEVVIRISVYNFLDKKYISNGYSYSGYSGGQRSDYNYYFPQAGINWLAGVTIGI